MLGSLMDKSSPFLQSHQMVLKACKHVGRLHRGLQGLEQIGGDAMRQGDGVHGHLPRFQEADCSVTSGQPLRRHVRTDANDSMGPFASAPYIFHEDASTFPMRLGVPQDHIVGPFDENGPFGTMAGKNGQKSGAQGEGNGHVQHGRRPPSWCFHGQTQAAIAVRFSTPRFVPLASSIVLMVRCEQGWCLHLSFSEPRQRPSIGAGHGRGVVMVVSGGHDCFANLG